MPPGELARLYDTHAPALFAFLLNFTRDEADTRDILQEVFLRLARRLEDLPALRDERAFLLRLAHNLAVDTVRRRDTQRRAHAGLAAEPIELFAAGPDTQEPAVPRQVAEAMGDLPPEQRAVLQLKLWEGLTFDAIGRLLEIPLNTAASRYRYALNKLRERLRPLYDEIR